MEAYYDSDEEIAWGPLTLREIKKSLSTKRLVKTRHSIDAPESRFDNFNTSIYHTAEEDANKESEYCDIDTTQNSTYRTTTENICWENSNIDGNSFRTAGEELNGSDQLSNYNIVDDDVHHEEQIEHIGETEKDNDIIDISSDKENEDNDSRLLAVKQEKSSIIKEKHSNSTFETINLCSESENDTTNYTTDYSTTDNNSHIFNDTLEEMQNALKELQTNNKIDNTDEKKDNQENHFVTTQRLQLKKYDYIVSPIGKYIHEKSPIIASVEKFKTPKPLTKRTPNSMNHNFRNIVSPVALYIKNTPTTPLRQNIQTKSNVRIEDKSVIPPTVTHVSNDLPKSIYKPPKKTVQNDINGPNLPASIKNLVSLPVVTTHVKKMKKINENDNETLIDRDLTFACETTTDTSTDISFYNNKQVFIK